MDSQLLLRSYCYVTLLTMQCIDIDVDFLCCSGYMLVPQGQPQSPPPQQYQVPPGYALVPVSQQIPQVPASKTAKPSQKQHV